VFEALGDVDELNAHLGMCRSHCAAVADELLPHLTEIQSRLLDAGSSIATPLSSSSEDQKSKCMSIESLLSLQSVAISVRSMSLNLNIGLMVWKLIFPS
jgi:cob(I)alamin adenosyltransferase